MTVQQGEEGAVIGWRSPRGQRENGTKEAGHQVVIIVAVVVIEAVDINEEVVETPLTVSKA